MSDTEHQRAWMSAFSDEQRQQQLAEDREAWRRIIGILLAIVTVGSSSAALVVWAITKFSS